MHASSSGEKDIVVALLAKNANVEDEDEVISFFVFISIFIFTSIFIIVTHILPHRD